MNRFFTVLAAFLAVLVLTATTAFVVPAQAVTIVNGGSTLFSESFENDALGALPTVSAPDVGTGWIQHSGSTIVTNSDVVSGLTAEPRPGKYLNIANDGVENGRMIAQFADQASGLVEAGFQANVQGADSGGSLRIVYTNGETPVSHVHAGYLVTGFWLENQAGIGLPAGVDADDVVVAFHNNVAGVYEVLKAVGGTEADGAAIDGEGAWHSVTIAQDPTAGSFPQFSLNGVLLEPLPIYPASGDPISGLEFGSNGGFNTQAYVDGAIPEPTTALLLTAAGLMLSGIRRR
jgi:hypothetical protein